MDIEEPIKPKVGKMRKKPKETKIKDMEEIEILDYLDSGTNIPTMRQFKQ